MVTSGGSFAKGSSVSDVTLPASPRLRSPDGIWRRVVCAAVRYSDGRMLVGPRHFDVVMQAQHRVMGITADESAAVCGFIDQWGEFMDRYEALAVANARGQVMQKTAPYDRLFSEDLY